MKKLFSLIFIGSGGLLVVASGVIGLGFGRVFIADAISIGGRGAVIELVSIVIISGLGFGIGYTLMRIGKALKKNNT